jgi:bifunctional non-homologous end joining protein LigD
MLCGRAAALPAGAGWAFEPKWDGFRALASVSNAGLTVSSRHGTDFTMQLPELAEAATAIPTDTVLDGELVVCGDDGRPDFYRLTSRILGRAVGGARDRVTFVAFDVLRLGGRDLTAEPYRQRRAALESLPLCGCWQVTPATPHGPYLWASVLERDLEGVVAKRVTAPYRAGARGRDWLKIKNRRRSTVVVGGWTPGPDGGVRQLLVGTSTEGDGVAPVRYRGPVEIGIGPRTGQHLAELLAPLRTDVSPFGWHSRNVRWLQPQFSVQISHGPAAANGILREPALLSS